MKKITYLLAGAGIAMCILLGSVRPTFAQETVTGTVRSAEDGVPLPGATVKIAGTGAGTNTDENGRFELTDNRPVITISITSLRSEEHTSELQSLMRTWYAVCCWKKKK